MCPTHVGGLALRPLDVAMLITIQKVHSLNDKYNICYIFWMVIMSFLLNWHVGTLAVLLINVLSCEVIFKDKLK